MFKSIRRQYWVAKEFARRHFKLILRTIVLVVGFSVLAALFIRYIPTPRPHTRIGLVGKYSPETLPTHIQALVSTGLVTIDEAGQPQPAIADSWEVLNDGRKYVFHIDKSAKWHGGTKVKPEDLTYNFTDVQTSYSDDSVTFELQDPFAPFFHAVSKPFLKNGRLGVGEYTLAKSNVYAGILQSVILVSSTHKLTYKFYPTETSAITAFKLGEVDVLQSLTHVPEELSQDETILSTPNTQTPRIAVIFFNNNDSTLTSKPTRQALAYAIRDKSFGQSRATSPIPETSWAYNSLVKTYNYDAERARSLLAQDVLHPSTITLELKTMLQHLDIAELVAEDWQETLGINVEVKVVTSLTSDYQAFLADFAPPADPDQYTVWHSTQPTNFTHYTNLKIDKLLEDGRRTIDQKIRKDIYQDFQRFLVEDSPAVFLFQTSAFDLSRNNLLSFN